MDGNLDQFRRIRMQLERDTGPGLGETIRSRGKDNKLAF
ncbi:hypothetical protein RBSWK_05385 [Rhodopirellula baltica SWK14]|nr:hypothetical protein RBSWK_05385 [Rhodopirellula baltica SWK14]